MAILWGVVFASLYIWIGGRARRTAAIWIGLAVVSHWVLDWVTHRPDLPMAPWSDVKVGLGLWRSMPATIVVESAASLAVFALGLWLLPLWAAWVDRYRVVVRRG